MLSANVSQKIVELRKGVGSFRKLNQKRGLLSVKPSRVVKELRVGGGEYGTVIEIQQRSLTWRDIGESRLCIAQSVSSPREHSPRLQQTYPGRVHRPKTRGGGGMGKIC